MRVVLRALVLAFAFALLAGAQAQAQTLSVSPLSLTYSKTSGAANPPTQEVTITNTGTGTLNYTIAAQNVGFTISWATPPQSLAAGMSNVYAIQAQEAGIGPGSYTTQWVVSCTGCTGSSQTVNLTFNIGPSTGDVTAPVRDPISPPCCWMKESSTATSITMKWPANFYTDNVAVTSYSMARNVVIYAPESHFVADVLASGELAHTITGLTCGTTYNLKFRAHDAAGNNSLFSPQSGSGSPISTNACGGDTTAPSVPTGLNQTANGMSTITAGWTASTDNVAVTGYDVYLDGVLKSSAQAGTSYQFTGLTCSTSHAVTVRARDAATNTSALTSAVTMNTATCGGLPVRWSPAKLTTWYWEISTVPTNLTRSVAAYDVDGAENSKGAMTSTVNSLHTNGKKAICYFSAGTWEDFREDAASFPAAVQGNAVGGFPNEKWLDVRAVSTLKPLMIARMQICRAKGFDAVEPDNMDGYLNTPGFTISAAEQITYNQMIAVEAHKLGLAVFLKNDIDQLSSLVASFDGAVNEQCIEFAECTGYSAFLSSGGFNNAGKPVLGAEYAAISGPNCSTANTDGRMTAQFALALDGSVFTPCWPGTQPIVLGGTTTAGP